MNHFKISSVSITVLITLSFLLTYCTDEIPKSDLVFKNNLLYKIDSDVPFTGHEKAKINVNIIEYDVKDGYKHGKFRLYDLDGNLLMDGQIDSNRNVGKWQYFFEDGGLESEGSFNYDRPDGKWTWYYPDGKIKEEGIYNNGIRIGLWRQYTTDGNVYNQRNYDLKDSADTKQNTAQQ